MPNRIIALFHLYFLINIFFTMKKKILGSKKGFFSSDCYLLKPRKKC